MFFRALKAEHQRMQSSLRNIEATSNRLETFLSWRLTQQSQLLFNTLKFQREKLMSTNRLYQSYVIKVLAMKKLKFFFERREFCIKNAFQTWHTKSFLLKKFIEQRRMKYLSILFNGEFFN